MTQFVPIVDGFWQNDFGGRRVPTNRMLLEMIKPGADHELEELLPLSIEHWNCIPNLGSQLLLRAYSNDFFERFSPIDGMGEILESRNIPINDFFYHSCIVTYIHNFFGRQPNLAVDKEAARELIGFYSSLHTKPMGESLSEFSKLEKISKLKKLEPSVKDNGDELREKFPDYQKSSEFIQSIYNDPILGLAHLGAVKKNIDSLFAERLSGYRPAKKSKSQKTYKLQQCNYCFSWFESDRSNGKISAHCNNKKSCKQDYERLRKRK
jgi:hypothetical protein